MRAVAVSAGSLVQLCEQANDVGFGDESATSDAKGG
jgi:hypothetical protein